MPWKWVDCEQCRVSAYCANHCAHWRRFSAWWPANCAGQRLRSSPRREHHLDKHGLLISGNLHIRKPAGQTSPSRQHGETAKLLSLPWKLAARFLGCRMIVFALTEEENVGGVVSHVFLCCFCIFLFQRSYVHVSVVLFHLFVLCMLKCIVACAFACVVCHRCVD